MTTETLTFDHRQQLDKQGYVVISLSPEEWRDREINLDEFCRIVDELVEKEGWRGGRETLRGQKVRDGEHTEKDVQRLSVLVDKHPIFRQLMVDPYILAGAHHIIAGEMKLSDLQMRDPLPGGGWQRLHIDGPPRVRDSDPFSFCACYLFLDDANEENGALRVVPGSHKILGAPKYHVDVYKPHPDEIQLGVPRGTLVITNPQIWHGGGKNISGARRRALFINYKTRSAPQQANMKRWLREETLQQLSDVEEFLLAVRPEDSAQYFQDWVYDHRNTWYVKSLVKVKQALTGVLRS